MNKNDAALLLGMKEEEITDVADSAAGPVIRTFDGATLVVVGDDTPDAAGNSGIMFLVAPGDGRPYTGSFPVYRPHADEADVEDELGISLDDPAPRAGDAAAGPDARLNQPEVQATAEALVTDPGPGGLGTGDGGTPSGVNPNLTTTTSGVSTAVPAQSSGGAVASATNAETGATNIVDPANAADPGTVVPDGPAHVVEAWVGDDAARARQAIDFENTKPSPRSSLIAKLDKIAGA